MMGQDLLQEVVNSGYSLAVIAACSLLAIGIAVERVIAMWGIVADARALFEQVTKSLLRGDLAQARATCERSGALAAEVLLAGFARHGQGATETFAAAVERERLALTLKLKSHLWLLGTIGTISPFVGLFGTVLGISHAFESMAAAGTGGFVVVANGIKGALVATAAGIFVAVEAVVFYNYFQARLARTSAQLRLLIDEFVELMREQPPAASAVSAPAGPPPAATGAARAPEPGAA